MEEIWKDVVNWEGIYQVSNLGRVKSLAFYKKSGYGSKTFKPERILTPIVGKNGYLRVNLIREGRHTFASIHHIVAEAFIPNPGNLPQVNHKDENKQNNVVSNLEWCTAKYNTNYGMRNLKASISLKGKTGGGRRNYKPVIQIDSNSIIIAEYKSMTEAQKATNIKLSTISSCCRGRIDKAGGYKWRYKT